MALQLRSKIDSLACFSLAGAGEAALEQEKLRVPSKQKLDKETKNN